VCDVTGKKFKKVNIDEVKGFIGTMSSMAIGTLEKMMI